MKKIIYFLSFVMLVAAGCKKSFLDINQNPNEPSSESITPELILPRVLHVTGERMATDYDFLARWMGYWARSGAYGPSPDEESYKIGTDFEQTLWGGTGSIATAELGWYDVLFDNDQMEKKAEAAGQPFYQAIAKIMKSVGFMYLVDSYNNVPYFSAFNLAENTQPIYDKGEDIYADLLKQLDEANTLLKDADNASNPGIETSDIMFHGDATMWRKFSNTQRLKLLIRQSQIPGFNPAAEIAKITADGSGFLGSGETASVNPGYSKAAGRQNPFWNINEQDVNGNVANNYDRANNYVLNIFKSTSDIRYKYFFDAAASPINAADPYVGFNYGEVLSNAPLAGQSSNIGGPGLAKSPSQDQWIFTSVESLFLQAEAIQRGWIPGVAKDAYENAVRESFIWLEVPSAIATANDYLAESDARVSWAAATTPEAKINLIAIQRYLALVGINNFEAWAQYRRLGVPAVPKSLAPSVASNIPVRLRYPQREYNLNAASVAAQGEIDPLKTPVFWDK